MSRIYAYNIGDYIPGTTQYGDIAVVTGSVNFKNTTVNWHHGPESEDSYLIVGYYLATMDIQFWRPKNLSERSFYDLMIRNFHQTFTTMEDANNWLLSQGYYSIETPNIITSGDDFITLSNDDILTYIL